jgi:1,4-dihydroxy-6-naphthoate synthase
VVVARRDLGEETIERVGDVLRDSIREGLDHRSEAMRFAMQFGRGLDVETADRFVAMYVNDLTLDMGDEGRRAVDELLARVG